MRYIHVSWCTHMHGCIHMCIYVCTHACVCATKHEWNAVREYLMITKFCNAVFLIRNKSFSTEILLHIISIYCIEIYYSSILYINIIWTSLTKWEKVQAKKKPLIPLHLVRGPELYHPCETVPHAVQAPKPYPGHRSAQHIRIKKGVSVAALWVFGQYLGN